jgi:long-chain fatty acid transport protein
MAAQMKWDVAAGFGQEPHDTATSPGIGATLGAKVAIADWLSIGAAYETKSYFQDFRFDIPAHIGVDPATFRPVPFAAGTDKLTFNQPMSAAVGVAIKPADALLLAVDVQWINWSDTNGTDKPVFSANNTGAMSWDLGWSDQVVFKAGAQYRPTKELALRAGYNYGKMPLEAHCAFENLVFPAVSEHHFSAGAGYDFGQLTVNAGATWSPKATLSGSNPDYPANGGQAIQSYSTSMSQISFDLGIAVRL